MTAQDLQSLGVIDEIVPEPVGGAHRDTAAAIANLRRSIATALKRFAGQQGDAVRQAREEKFLAIGRL